jgi:hypothetical protein
VSKKSYQPEPHDASQLGMLRLLLVQAGSGSKLLGGPLAVKMEGMCVAANRLLEKAREASPHQGAVLDVGVRDIRKLL